jgi:UDP-N-acetylmuramyl pentapeptide synthase
MTQARMQKARRLLDLHKDLQRLEEERIVGLRSRQAELAAEQDEIVASLNSDAAQGLVMPLILRRMKSLGEESTRVAEELERRARALRVIASRTKHAERISRTYDQLHTRSRAEKELLDIIERITQPKDASLP